MTDGRTMKDSRAANEAVIGTATMAVLDRQSDRMTVSFASDTDLFSSGEQTAYRCPE